MKKDHSTQLLLQSLGVPEVRLDDEGNEYLLFPDGRKQFSGIYKTIETYRKEGFHVRRVLTYRDD